MTVSRAACARAMGVLLLLMIVPLVALTLPPGARAIAPTFEPNVRVDDSDSSVDSPRIAAGPSVLHAAWRDMRAGDVDIYYSRSTDGGLSWSPAVRLDDSPGTLDAGDMDLAVNQSGSEVYLAFTDRRSGSHDIRVRASQDDGLNWGPAVRADDAAAGFDALHPALAVDATGVVHLAFEDRRNLASPYQIYHARSATEGTTWSPNVPVSATPPGESASTPSLSAAGNGELHAIWRQRGSLPETILSGNSMDSGASWTVTPVFVVAFFGEQAMFPDVSLRGPGQAVFAVWTHQVGSNRAVRFSSSADGGVTWGASVRVDDVPSTFIDALPESPTMSVLYGSPFVLWTDQRNTYRDLYASGSDDGGVTWGDCPLPCGDNSDTKIDDSMVNDMQSSPSSSSNALGLFAVWEDGRNTVSGGNPDIYFSAYLRSEVLLTEFRDSPDLFQEAVELFVFGGKTVDFTGWMLVADGVPHALSPLGSVPGMQYRTVGNWGSSSLPIPVFSLGDSDLNHGGTIKLVNPFGVVVDEVSYGQLGVVPDPPSSPPSTTACRYFDGVAYFDEWTLDISPTLNAQNNCGRVDPAPPLILNEVLYSAANPADRFVELWYVGDTSVNTTGFRVVGNTVYTITAASGVTLSPANPAGMVSNAENVLLFNNLRVAGDNLYLFDASWNLLDEVGWDAPHTADLSLCRSPDANGTHDGYDDGSSVAAGWRFGCTPTPPLIGVGPSPQFGRGDFGDVVRFNVTVTNKQLLSDFLDLTFTSEPNGWLVELFDAADMLPLGDTAADGDGIPDLGLQAREAGVNATVRVTIPWTPPVSVSEWINVTATASSSPVLYKQALLRVDLNPFLDLERWADPTTINVLGTGYGEQTSLTLEMTGRGVALPSLAYNAADVVFVIDDTGSMGPWIDGVRTDVVYILTSLQANVSDLQLGLVSYGDVAEIDIDLDLTPDTIAFQNALNALVASGGGDWPEDPDVALGMAANLSWRSFPGGLDPARIMILIGDAPPHIPESELVWAANWSFMTKQIHTNAIACGGDFDTNLWFSQAAASGAGYFAQLGSPDQIADEILTGILQYVPGVSLVATDPDVTDTNPMVRDVLPSHIGIVPNTFVDPLTLLPRPPDFWGVDVAGNTVLEWNVSLLRVNDSWSVRFQVTSSLPGLVQTNVYGSSRASFLNWDNRTMSLPFPEAPVTVLAPLLLPPSVAATWDGALGVGLAWVPPAVVPDHYLIYRVSGDPRGFTALGPAAAYAIVYAPATAWSDPDPIAGPGERYYLMRSANAGDVEVSATSNTAGVFVGALRAGATAVSRPLEYVPWIDYSGAALDTVEEHRVAFGATSVEYVDAAGAWRAVPGNGDPNRVLAMGEAYVFRRPTPDLFVFTGLPGGMLRFDETPFPGFLPASSARSLLATVSGDDVILSFDQPAGMTPGVDAYEVWWSPTRSGFYTGGAFLVGGSPIPAPAGPTAAAVHAGAVLLSNELYYQVVPVSAGLGRGASTYTVGVWTRTFSGATTFGLPLRPDTVRAVSWYSVAIPGAQGFLWLSASGVWVPHFTAMAAGTYDAAVPLGAGFQIGLRPTLTTRYSFVGW